MPKERNPVLELHSRLVEVALQAAA